MISTALRSAAVAALAALAAIAAIVVADFTVPVSAQSEEITGRIVARQLADGRVEFGWQATGSARVLPRQRYLTKKTPIDLWLRSSRVRVAGDAIGRINAKRLADGRIEFGFTPINGERIEPRARYFPADARVDRWLRSTPIRFTPPPVFVAVSANETHACGLREDGSITCWGSSGEGQTDTPPGSYRAVSVGRTHTCGLREDDRVRCWGNNYGGKTDHASGSYSAISAGTAHTCGLYAFSGLLACWGANQEGQSNAPTGSFTAVDAGTWHTCAIRRSDSAIECWGWTPTAAPAGSFSAVSADAWHSCGLRTNGEIECWIHNPQDGDHFWFEDPPAGNYTAVSVGLQHACGLRSNGELVCWGGTDQYGESSPPAGRYSAVSAGQFYTCGLRTDGEIVCWGWKAFRTP